MTMCGIFMLAIALAVDAFAVSFSYGLILKQNRLSNTLKLAGATGFAQFIMPLFGWLGANIVASSIKPFAHWIAFAIFMILGLNIIYKSFTSNKENEKEEKQQLEEEYKNKSKIILTGKALFILSFATSVDAFFAGATLFFIDVNIFTAVSVIGILTFVLSAIAYNLNVCFKKLPVKVLEVGAGLILILLALKSLSGHLF